MEGNEGFEHSEQCFFIKDGCYYGYVGETTNGKWYM